MSEQEAVEAIKPSETEPIKRILVADDEEFMTTLLRRILGEEFDVTTVKDGKEAWGKLNTPEEKFDLLITDKDMPEASGLEVLQAIRDSDNKHLKEMPVIMMSGQFNPLVTQQVRKLGGQAIEKPFSSLRTVKEMVVSTLKTSVPPAPETSTE